MRDGGGPGFFLAGLEFGDEMFPVEIEFFVFPGDVDAARFEIAAIFADLGNVDRESAAHGFGDGETDLLLGLAGFGPETLEELMVVLDFDEGSAFSVTSA